MWGYFATYPQYIAYFSPKRPETVFLRALPSLTTGVDNLTRRA
jgi:hypothetical protein